MFCSSRLIAAACAVVMVAVGAMAAPVADEDTRVLVIVLDGLRPDYVTPDLMPNLYALGQEGVWCENQHSAIPTVTRMNSASIATGAYPETHGFLGNSVYCPEVDKAHSLTASKVENLLRVDEATSGKLVTAVTLGEVLEANGQGYVVMGTSSSGTAFMQNPRMCGAGIINSRYIAPESLKERVEKAVGPAPPAKRPNTAAIEWAVDAYLDFAIDELAPRVTVMWLSEPDSSAHYAGVGAPLTKEAIQLVDGQVQRIVAAHEERGMKVDLIVMSDHGFSTQAGGAEDVKDLLVEAGLKESASSDDVVVVGGAVFVNREEKERAPKIAALLQSKPWAGAVFARAKAEGSHEGWVDGTLALDVIHWDHARSAAVYVEPLWNNNANEFGFKGEVNAPGKAGHGTTSPWDIHCICIAFGPDFKKGLHNSAPTGNVDVAPTVCHLLGLAPPATMTGRVLEEIIEGGPAPDSLKVTEEKYAAAVDLADGRYEAVADLSTVKGHRYVNHTTASHTGK